MPIKPHTASAEVEMSAVERGEEHTSVGIGIMKLLTFVKEERRIQLVDQKSCFYFQA
jgi:hypothetical protein